MDRHPERRYATVRDAVTGAALLALVSGMGAANAAGQQQADAFSQLDHDSDGSISYSEAKADPALSEDFNRLDDDKNGELDRGEFAQFEAQGLTKTPDILPPEGPGAEKGRPLQGGQPSQTPPPASAPNP